MTLMRLSLHSSSGWMFYENLGTAWWTSITGRPDLLGQVAAETIPVSNLAAARLPASYVAVFHPLLPRSIHPVRHRCFRRDSGSVRRVQYVSRRYAGVLHGAHRVDRFSLHLGSAYAAVSGTAMDSGARP